MLEPDQWENVLGTLVGVQFRGTERLASATILDALGVPQDKEAYVDVEAAREDYSDVAGNEIGRRIRLHPKQLVAFRSKATEILYRGAAGGGKPHLMRAAA
jgi:hypothetical protein